MKLQFNPISIFFIYLTVILVYSLVYWLLPSGAFNVEMYFTNSFYFSVVTITTLGYGDILPGAGYSKILVATESIIGLVLIGVFLNSLWNNFSEKEISARKKMIEDQSKVNRLKAISAYSEYLLSTINNHLLSIADVSQNMGDKLEYIEGRADRLEIQFSGLASALDFSIFTANMFSSSFALYIERYNLLRDELKYFLSNIDLRDFPDIKRGIIEFLIETNNYDNNEALKKIFELQCNEESPFYGMKEKIQSYEGQPCPELDEYSSNLITPIIILYESLVLQESSLYELKRQIQAIQHADEAL